MIPCRIPDRTLLGQLAIPLNLPLLGFYVLLSLFNLSDSICPSLTFVLNTLKGNLIMKYTSL